MPDYNDVAKVGPFGSRPAPGHEGATYYAEDTDQRFRDNGVAWVEQPAKVEDHAHDGDYSALGHSHGGYEAAGTAASAVSTHAGLSDPHTGYQQESEKAQASGYASLDGSTKVPIAQIPTGATGSTVPLGNDSRLADARTPTAHASTHNAGGGDALAIDAAAGTGSLRTLGTGATQAAAGPHSHGAGSFTRTAIGTTSIGGSFDATMKTIMKKITLPTDGLLVSLLVALKGLGNGGFNLTPFVMTDSSGTPGIVVAIGGGPSRSGAQSAGTAHTHVPTSQVGVINTTARFIALPMGAWLTAGDYWIGFINNAVTGNDVQYAYASGSGSDRTKSSTDGPYDHSVGASSTGTNDYSIYANVLT